MPAALRTTGFLSGPAQRVSGSHAIPGHVCSCPVAPALFLLQPGSRSLQSGSATDPLSHITLRDLNTGRCKLFSPAGVPSCSPSCIYHGLPSGQPTDPLRFQGWPRAPPFPQEPAPG